MKNRLTLAKGLVLNTLSDTEREVALANGIVVAMAKTLRASENKAKKIKSKEGGK